VRRRAGVGRRTGGITRRRWLAEGLVAVLVLGAAGVQATTSPTSAAAPAAEPIASARWDMVASGDAVDAIRMVDANRGWAVGNAGLVMATTDGGESWTRRKVPISERLAAVAAVDASRVWVGGWRGTILASNDGGESWSLQPTPLTEDVVTGIAFPTPSRGFAVTDSGGFIRTDDGGATWQGEPGKRTRRFWAVDFFDDRHGVVVGGSLPDNGLILRTSDGGATWSESHVSGVSHSTLFSVDMVSPSEAWAGSGQGFAFHSTDGGSTWAHVLMPDSETATGSLFAIGMTAGGTGWAVAGGPLAKVLRTVDAGATWTVQEMPPDDDLHGLAVIDATHVLIGAGGASVLRTTDGIAWSRRDAGLEWVTDDLLAVDFPDPRHGWAVGDGGTISATTDGGVTWRRQPSGTDTQLRSVDFVDALEGWIVGGDQSPEDPSLVLHTIDGGATWAPVAALPYSSRAHVVRFADADHGVIGSSSGLSATADGGATWSGVSDMGSVTDLDFPTPLVGYSGGTVAKTVDGGRTWTRLRTNTPNYPGTAMFVDFVDARTGWIDGRLRTTDGGDTWSEVGNDPGFGADVTFVDANRGARAGSTSGSRTVDAGAHWYGSEWRLGGWGLPFASHYVRAIAFADTSNGWAVGTNGLILRAPNREAVDVSIAEGPSAPSGTGRTTTLAVEVRRSPTWIERSGPLYPSSSLPAGTVTFRDHGVPLATVALGADGRAVHSGSFSGHVHAFSATYDGDAVYAAERTPALVVNFNSPPPATATTSPTTTMTATPVAPLRRRSGYWMVGRTGDVYAFGDAAWMGNAPAPSPAADLEPTTTGNGYWVVDTAGRVLAFGDARAMGDAGTLAAGEEVTSLSRTPSGNGYWMFTTTGRVLPRGDAPFLGDLSGTRLNGPVLDSIPVPDGGGYYLVASDGGVFAFGSARFRGSMGAARLNAPVRSLVPDADGAGYWLVASDGGIFSFDAPYFGSMGGRPLNRPVTGMVRSAAGAGYLMVAEDGGIFAFGDVPFHGSLGNRPPAAPVVSVAAVP
jgi:photosystem II stability/assembly factor-like uncharacterized protein